MKRKIYFVPLLILLFITSSCQRDFLEAYPIDEQTEATAFITSENFSTFAIGLYSIFPAYSDDTYADDVNGGNFVRFAAGGESAWAMSRVVVPSSDGGWDFSYIRKVNLMLDNIDGSSMSEKDKAHWRSVGYFFRSYRYMELLSNFGDVTWVSHVLNESSPELFAAKDSRDVIASNLLSDLEYASANIYENGNGVNTINALVVNAFISRFALFEGTWRKYHGLDGADKYLRAALNASKKVINKVPVIHNNYDALFNSESLAGIPGILLYKNYAAGRLMHNFTRKVRTGEAVVEGTRDLVDSYLCTDGHPISTSSVYAGNSTEFDNFRNRDRRLYLTICPPYRTGSPNSGNYTSWIANSNPIYNEYLVLINNANWTAGKKLPHTNFRDFVSGRQPNLKNSANGSHAWGSTNMGYFMWKYYNTTTDCSGVGTNTTDAPIFRVEEVMLNYAEAAFELAEFDQSIADITINKLRQRAGVASMNVSLIDSGWDLKRDDDIPPVLWEIRRERRVELVGEGFAFKDIRRWKKAAKQLNKQPNGAFINKADYGNSSTLKLQDANGNTISNNNVSGFLWNYGKPTGWLTHYYLYPLPLNDLQLNKNLKQNPDW